MIDQYKLDNTPDNHDAPSTQKRKANDENESPGVVKRPHVSMNAYNRLERRCVKLEREIDLYQTTWMRRLSSR